MKGLGLGAWFSCHGVAFVLLLRSASGRIIEGARAEAAATGAAVPSRPALPSALRLTSTLGIKKEGVMKMANQAVIATIFVIGFANTVDAKCRKSQVCDNHGMNCRVMDICDSKLDLPSIELPPLRPLPSMELKPLPSLELPPLGTTRCQYMQVNGRWQNICW